MLHSPIIIPLDIVFGIIIFAFKELRDHKHVSTYTSSCTKAHVISQVTCRTCDSVVSSEHYEVEEEIKQGIIISFPPLSIHT